MKAIMDTAVGKVSLELFENDAPNTVANFVKLINEGFYNGLRNNIDRRTKKPRIFRGFLNMLFYYYLTVRAALALPPLLPVA